MFVRGSDEKWQLLKSCCYESLITLHNIESSNMEYAGLCHIILQLFGLWLDVKIVYPAYVQISLTLHKAALLGSLDF